MKISETEREEVKRTFDVNCIECGTPVAVKWNSRKKLYDTIREED